MATKKDFSAVQWRARLLGASGARHAENNGPFSTDLSKTCRRECQDAAELGAGEAAAVGAGRRTAHRTGSGSASSVKGYPVNVFCTVTLYRVPLHRTLIGSPSTSTATTKMSRECGVSFLRKTAPRIDCPNGIENAMCTKKRPKCACHPPELNHIIQCYQC